MEIITQFLIEYGSWGMFLAALLSGSVLPFSSEAVMLALLAMHVNPWHLLIAGSLGNSIGGATCYWMGRLIPINKLQRFFHIKPEHMERAEDLVQRKGPYMAFLGFVPLLGTAILLTLGIMRSNAAKTNIAMVIGKTIRYIAILLPALGLGMLLK